MVVAANSFATKYNVLREHLHRDATHIEFLHNNRTDMDGLRFRTAIQWGERQAADAEIAHVQQRDDVRLAPWKRHKSTNRTLYGSVVASQYYESTPLHGERLDSDTSFADRTLRLELSGQRITLPALLAASKSFLGILEDVDANVTEKPGGAVDWVVSDMESGSAIFEIQAHPRGEQTPFNAQAEAVRRFRHGMRVIVERGERPPYFSEAAMRHVYDLTTILDENGIQAIKIGNGGDLVQLRPTDRKAVRQALEGKYRAIGSIEARIETLSAHDKPFGCTAWTLLRNEPIRCYFDAELVDVALRHFRQRVTLRGVISSRGDGEVTSMRVHSIEPFPHDDELPTVDQIRGLMANG